MSGFRDIIGQETIKEQLQTAIANNRISHAYIINGETGSGKEFVAKTFAAAIHCKEDGVDACGECHSCKQAASGNHPDIITVTHEKPNTISVNDIRDQIINDIIIKPYSSDYKVYIMNEGEKMNNAAQNALLKTLEEPPEYAVIIILTNNVSALLPTIISRCTVLNMNPVNDKTVRAYLMKQLSVPDYQADICVAFARGNIGRAKSLALSEEFNEIKDEAIRVLKYIHEMDMSGFLESIKKIEEFKVNIYDFLDILIIWYRDVLMFKAMNDAGSLVFKDEIKYIRDRANQSSYEGIEEIINAIEKTKVRLRANVNFNLTLELLLMTIKEN